ncbi:MAG: hypothetical protein COY42_22975 [Armatimonadetes bacterium CG_4_10_14_0_8_um_filter_66_14]|nr:MAG: hypothetical protein COY42_22975 [Armatimonadetes bacterium CG_4_10_14_0_8_um_filter_66_14]PJB75414.1 MAG: hypothetical protein CO096_02110 [Armatimonadetes bacterium CG_4_9_14_3_um_filter_66_14]
MNRALIRSFALALLLCAVAGRSTAGPAPESDKPAPGKSPAPSAANTLKQAEKEKKHAVVLAYRSLDLGTEIETVRALLAKLANAADWQKKAVFYQLDLAKVADSDQDFVEEYRLESAPLPLTLVFAPNGAMVKYFARETYDDKQLKASFAGPVRADVVKQLQDGKAVLAFAPGKDAEQNAKCLNAAQELVKQPRLNEVAVVVIADPKAAEAKDFFEFYGLNDQVQEATVHFLFAPGRWGGQAVDETDTDALFAAMLRAFNSGGGCCGG